MIENIGIFARLILCGAVAATRRVGWLLLPLLLVVATAGTAAAQTPSSVIVDVSPNPSTYGEVVLINAQVSGLSSTPTGTVTFTGPGGFNEIVALNGSGEALIGTAILESGTITATYNGDLDNFSSVSIVEMTVSPASTITSVVVDPVPSVFGELVNVTATVAANLPGGGTPVGSVSFTGPGGLNESVALDNNGQATLSTTASSTGTITATFTGNANHSASVGTADVIVDPAATTTDLSVDPATSVTGQTVTLTATITTNAPGSGTPTGTVTFFDNNGALGTTGLVNGVATTSSSTLPTGQVTAYFNAGGNFAASDDIENITVNSADTATTVTADPATSVSGEPVVLTATVAATAPGSGTPTGSVDFYDAGANFIGTGVLSNGVAVFMVATLTTGTITANYGGDLDYNVSTGTVAVTVNAADTTTSVSATPDPSISGETVTVTATVTPIPPGSGTPTGSVTFTGTAGLSETVALDGIGQATLTSTTLVPGTITATYNGDAAYTASSGSTTVTVGAADTTTNVVATPNDSVTGETVTVTATVAAIAPSTRLATGTVTFTGPGGLNQTVGLDSGGQAAFTTTTLATGTITATYNGAPNISTSNGTVAVTVNPAFTTISVSKSPDPTVYGEDASIDVTVTPVAPGSGTPTGTVTVTAPGGLTQTIPLLNGVTSIALNFIETGTVNATYNGDADYNGSTGAVAVTVNPASTTTTVAATPDPSVSGETVSVTATVTATAPSTLFPTGTVTFTGPGGLNQTVTIVNGQASLNTTDLASGTITATYNGATNFITSTDTVDVTVDAADTTTVVVATPNPSVSGETVTVTATITANSPGSGTPTGTVTFSGPFTTQTVTISNGQASLTTASLATGTITAIYNGDALYNPSNGTVGVAVDQATTTTTLTASPDPSVWGETVILTATVVTNAPGSGTATGDVTFTGSGIGSTVALVNGVATLSATTLTMGTYTAVYNGATGYASSTDTVNVVVNQAATTTTVTANPDPSVAGETVTITATVTTNLPGSGTPSGYVNFVAAGLNEVVLLVNGVATLTSTTGVSGTITAQYTGDIYYDISAGTVGITVNAADSTTAVVATPNPSLTGETVTVTATVAAVAPATGIPTGTVTFTGPGGLSQTVALDGAGEAALTSTTLASGTITATYNGDAFRNTSTGTTAVTVGTGATTTSVVATPDPSITGQSVTLTATVAVVAPAVGTATGSVTFTGPGLNETVALDGAGQAVVTTTALTSGTVTVTYGGDADFIGSTGTATVTVNQGATTTSLASSRNPSAFGESVTFTATVAAEFATPTGSVTFFDGATALGTATLSGGAATLTTTTLALGEHSITAGYAGSAGFVASTSSALVQSVAVPVDSVRLRAMQILTTKLAATTSGAAFSSAVLDAIYTGFTDGGTNLVINPGSITFNYAPEVAADVPWPEGRGSYDAEANNWQMWGDLRAAGVGEFGNGGVSNISGMQLNALMGLTYKLNPDLLVGVVGGFEGFNYRSDSLNANLTGDGYTVGAYAGAKLGEDITLAIAGAYSGIGYDASSGAASASFDADRWMGTGGLTGNIEGYGMVFEPSLSVFGLWEQQDGYTDSLGIAQPARDFMTGRVSVGGKLTYPVASEGMEVLPYAGLYADYNISGDNGELAALGLGATPLAQVLTDGLSARAVGGVDVVFDGGARLGVGGEIGGLGGGVQNWSLRAGLNQNF